MDTSKRAMDVAKMQQANEEDPEFVRQRRAAIDNLLTSQTTKTNRFAQQNVRNGANLAKGFEQANQKMANERAKTASVALSSLSISTKPTNTVTSAEVIKSNPRCKWFFDIKIHNRLFFIILVPEWAKYQIADEAVVEDKRRTQPDRKQASKPSFNDDDNRSKRGGGNGFGRNRRGRGRDDDDGGEEKRPDKAVTLFDFFEAKPACKNCITFDQLTMHKAQLLFSCNTKASWKNSKSRFKTESDCC